MRGHQVILILSDGIEEARQRSGICPLVVCTDEADVFAASVGETLIPSIVDAVIFFAMPPGDVIFESSNNIDGAVSRCAVDDQQLPIYEGLFNC